ncbi:helix-turn-helix transcriptional regulator [Nocardioides sp. T2.26MG-1]|uniref:helix-turn-helix transcriptional regulator n=1 Tax=Nocardioides sp. T2.26MG-1 TaxID=3041166 RepID=UPI0024777784|nr:helix-turn-helix domain-containing protein [Nocardioides sp. T2.26MG-1]CAI9412746.1 hypothetical protein HIDPHFAB_01853 [Nocardioides sp. T2.26MG-1]
MSRAPERGGRERVLAVLRGARQPMSIVEIARRLDVHANTVRFHLDTLTEQGRVERVEATNTGPGRPPLLFRITPGMDPAGPRNYEMLAGILVEGLAREPDADARAERFGDTWGRGLVASPPASQTPGEATDTLVAMLDDLGFAAERRGGGTRLEIGLRHCPFLELSSHRTDVVCPLHLGLMRGVMGQLASGVSVESLEPYVEPDLCLTRLVLNP